MNCPHCGEENDLLLDLCFGCGGALSEIESGSVIANRFELLVEIGKGGMGRIFRVHDRVLDEEIALKVLRHELVDSTEMSQRFREEVRLARRVAHPNVCCMYDYGKDGNIHYITMEFIDGVDLKKTLLSRRKGLDPDEAFRAVIGVGSGLQAIHEQGSSTAT